MFDSLGGRPDWAIRDGGWKLLSRRQPALFDLTADPREEKDLSTSASSPCLLRFYRAALAAQFEREGRGKEWVLPNGTLPARPVGQLYGPNYPGQPPAVEGDVAKLLA